MATATEKYIKKAIKEAKEEFSGHILNGCSVEMNFQAEGATKILAQAMEIQAEANKANSEAMLKLAESLKPIDACGFRITNDNISAG